MKTIKDKRLQHVSIAAYKGKRN